MGGVEGTARHEIAVRNGHVQRADSQLRLYAECNFYDRNLDHLP